MVERGAREMPGRAFCEHRHLRDDVGAGLEVAELALRLARAPCRRCGCRRRARGRRADGRLPSPARRTCHRPLPARRGTGTSARSTRSSCRGCATSAAAGSAAPARSEEVDALARHRAVGRQCGKLLRAALEEAPHRPRVHHRTREEVRARLLALVDERHGHLAQALGRRRVAPRGAGRDGSHTQGPPARRRRSGSRPRCDRRVRRSEPRSPRRSRTAAGNRRRGWCY